MQDGRIWKLSTDFQKKLSRPNEYFNIWERWYDEQLASYQWAKGPGHNGHWRLRTTPTRSKLSRNYEGLQLSSSSVSDGVSCSDVTFSDRCSFLEACPALFARRLCSLTPLCPGRTSFMPSLTGRRPEVVSDLQPKLRWLSAWTQSCRVVHAADRWKVSVMLKVEVDPHILP